MEDGNSITNAQNFREFGRNYDDRVSFFCKSVNDTVYFALCAYVNTPCGFVKKVNVGIRIEPFGKYNLLLVAAR